MRSAVWTRFPKPRVINIRFPTSIDWDKLPLLGDVIGGTHPGRTSSDQITGLLLRGDGVQFTAVGHLIYERCKQQGLGHEIPSNLFLQDERYIP